MEASLAALGRMTGYPEVAGAPIPVFTVPRNLADDVVRGRRAMETVVGDHVETTSALYIGYGAGLMRPTEPI